MPIFFTKNKITAIRIFNPKARYYRTIDEESAKTLAGHLAKVRIPGEYRNNFARAKEPGDYWTHRTTAQALVKQYPGIEIVELG